MVEGKGGDEDITRSLWDNGGDGNMPVDGYMAREV
jgi:hypothetical protein